jgi:predicted pyridoxine 5'-phosphate oxidase superfamily flavin-nucleotide-binding protein
MTTPWHEGEQMLQARAGVAGRMAEIGSLAIRTAMPDQHRQFFAQLPFILVGYQDQAGNVWSSLIGGAPGFVSSPDPKTLTVAAFPVSGDPLAAALTTGLQLGILGIEFPTRRRNRANGHVLNSGPDGFTLSVEESFGNCPKSISRRDYAAVAETTVRQESLRGLDDAAHALITTAMTFFVASSAGSGMRADVSHRGGPPGFVRIEPDGALTIPDYAGNFFFNTLGNIVIFPRAGLLFPDFLSGDLLQLSGEAWLVESDSRIKLPGAERLWRFRMTHGHWLHGALPLYLTAGEDSRFWPTPHRG